MRTPTIAGIALILVAAFLLFGGSFTSQRNVLEMGDITVTADEQYSVRPWIAGLMLIAGLALVGTDMRRRGS